MNVKVARRHDGRRSARHGRRFAGISSAGAASLARRVPAPQRRNHATPTPTTIDHDQSDHPGPGGENGDHTAGGSAVGQTLVPEHGLRLRRAFGSGSSSGSGC